MTRFTPRRKRAEPGPRRVVAQVRLPLDDDEPLLDVVAHLDVAAALLLDEVVARYRRGDPPASVPQDEAAATGAPRVEEEHLAIDWRAPALSIRHLIRAAHVVFAAYTTLDGERVHVAAVAPAAVAPGLAPGEVAVDHVGERLLVGTGDVPLNVTRVGSTSGFAFACERGLPTGAALGPGGQGAIPGMVRAAVP